MLPVYVHPFIIHIGGGSECCNFFSDELAGFEQSWKGNADMHMPGWENGFDFHSNIGK